MEKFAPATCEGCCRKRCGSNVGAEVHELHGARRSPRTATPAEGVPNLAPEWTQTARSAAASVSAARVANLAGWADVGDWFACFGCEVRSTPQHQNDGGAESKRIRVVLVAFRPKRYSTMNCMGCREMLRSCGKFLGCGRVGNNTNSALQC